MRQKIPYLVIGVLIGIIVMQWGMPVAESQTGVLGAETFVLRDTYGNTKGMWFTGDDGHPYLALGDRDGATIGMSTTSDGWFLYGRTSSAKIHLLSTGKMAFLSVSGSELAEVSVRNGVETFTSTVDLSVSPTYSVINILEDGKLTAHLPTLPGTASKPATWGQIKADPTIPPTYSAKPATPASGIDIAQLEQRLEQQYRAKLASLQ